MNNQKKDMRARVDHAPAGSPDPPANPYSEFEKRLEGQLSIPLRLEAADAPPHLREEILASLADLDADSSRQPGGGGIPGPVVRIRFAIAAILTFAAILGSFLALHSFRQTPAQVAEYTGLPHPPLTAVPEPLENVPRSLDALVSGTYEEEFGKLARDLTAAEDRILHVLTTHVPANPWAAPHSLEILNSRSLMRFNRGILDADGAISHPQS